MGGDGGDGSALGLPDGATGQSIDDAGGGGGGIGRIRVNSSTAASLGGTISPAATTGSLNTIVPPISTN